MFALSSFKLSFGNSFVVISIINLLDSTNVVNCTCYDWKLLSAVTWGDSFRSSWCLLQNIQVVDISEASGGAQNKNTIGKKFNTTLATSYNRLNRTSVRIPMNIATFQWWNSRSQKVLTCIFCWPMIKQRREEVPYIIWTRVLFSNLLLAAGYDVG